MTLRHPSDRGKHPLPVATVESVLGKVNPELVDQQVRAPASAPPPPPPPVPKKKVKKGPFVDL
jgi:hypothetical protein